MAFEITGRLKYDGSGWTSGLRQAKGEAQKASKEIASSMASAFSGDLSGGLIQKGLGALGLGALGGFAKNLADKLQEEFKSIKIGSMLLNVDPETFQKIRNVAEAGGSSAESWATGMEKVAINLQKVKEGGPEAEKLVDAFAALGVSLADLKSGDYQSVFFKIASYMKDAEVTGEKLAAIHEILGKSGAGLIPGFKVGMDSDRASAGLLSDDQLKNLEQMRKATAETDAIWKDIDHTAGGFFAKLFSGAKQLTAMPLAVAAQIMGGKEKQTVAEMSRQAQQEAIIKGKDADQRAAEAEAEKKARAAAAEAAAKQKEEDAAKKTASGKLPGMQAELTELEAQRKYGPDKAGYLKDKLARQQADMDKEMGQYAVGDPRRKEAYLRGVVGMGKTEADLRNLRTSKGGAGGPEIFDSLARIGGFGQGSSMGSRIEQLQERTATATEAIERNTRTNQADEY